MRACPGRHYGLARESTVRQALAVTHFDLVPVDPSDHALVQSWLAAKESVQAYDSAGMRPLGRVRTLGGLVASVRERRREFWAAVCDGEVLGFLDLTMNDRDSARLVHFNPGVRGRRLGTILKIADQRRIREWRPRMRYVWTGKAESNTPMIAINESIGYRLAGHDTAFQKKLA